jgi:membrane associated rhomboid family serine protease
LSKYFWEYPLTAGFSIFLFVCYIFISLLIPNSIQAHYFVSYPRSISPINWILSTLNHGSFAHLFWNLCFLFFLGRIVEAKVGKGKWLLFYFMAGIFGSMLDSIARGIIYPFDNTPAVGASGAICGIASVAALLSPFQIPIGKIKFPFPVFLVAWLMVYADFSNILAKDNIAHFAHLGGFGSVFFTAYLLNNKDKENLKNGFILNFVFFILSCILLYLLNNR